MREDVRMFIDTCFLKNDEIQLKYAGGELLEVVELPEDSDMRERRETQKNIFRFNI